MAINETVRDIENYPSKSKTITLDLQKIVPIDTEGDEIYVITSSPGTGVTKIGGGTISPIFVRDYKAGFFRSSGRKNPPFTVASGSNSLRISIDGSPFVSLTLSEGAGLSGESVADDLQAKINVLATISGGTVSGNLAFLNATVSFINNSFLVTAGSISNTYVGVGRTSVLISSGTSNDASVLLGFDKGHASELLAGKRPTETLLTAGYTSGTAISVESISDFTSGQAFTITDGVNREYFVASGLGANTINLHYELDNDYATGSVVQKVFERDPYLDIASPYSALDEITRFALRSIANQIDFSV